MLATNNCVEYCKPDLAQTNFNQPLLNQFIIGTEGRLKKNNYNTYLITVKISNILEISAYTNVVKTRYKINFFNNDQHGFLEGKSTTGIAALVHIVETDRDNKTNINGAFTDLQRAFDCINWSTYNQFYDSFKTMGVTGNILN